MLVLSLALLSILVVGLAQDSSGEVYTPASPWEFRSLRGWNEGDRVEYYDLGRAGNLTAPVYRLVDGAGNPVEGQHHIFDDLRPGVLVGAPASSNYSDFHRVWEVQVPEGYVPDDIRSVTDIMDAGLPMVERDLVWNTPMVPEGSALVGSEADTHPLLQGWWDGEVVWYFRFESSQDTPGLFDPGTGLVRDARAMAVFDPPGQLEIIDSRPGEATHSPLTRLYIFNPISTEYVADSVRSWEEAEALGFPIFPEGILYNRPMVGGRETYPRYDHAEPATYDLLRAWWDETGKVLYYDMGPMTDGWAPVYRFVNRQGVPLIAQHWLVESVAPGMLLGNVETGGYSTLWRFHDVVVEDETAFRPDVIKSMDDVRAMGFTINVTSEWMIAPMVTRDAKFLPAPSNAPGGGMVMAWYRGADVYLLELGDPSLPIFDLLEGGSGDLEVLTTNLTIILDPEGVPYPDLPILEGLLENESYSPVWSVMHASGGDGYRPGRFRSREHLEERGWSFETSGERILGGFVAGPINAPAWKPETFTFVVGPVVNEDGKAIKGARVRVLQDVDVEEGTTDAEGLVEFTVDDIWNGKTVQTFISREGYDSIEFPAEIVDYEIFVPAGGYVPPMVRVDDGDGLSVSTGLALVAVLVVGILVVLLLARGRSRDRPSITEEEADEIFSDEDEGEDENGEGKRTGEDANGMEREEA